MNIYDLINKDIHCVCGRTHRCDIPSLCIKPGALNELPELTSGFDHILIAADNNTAPLAAERVKMLLKDRFDGICVFSRTGLLVPNEKGIEELRSHLTDNTDLILGIGTGVINDLCKYVSFYRGISSGIIATAPSMDGFASSGAAMILGGMKITVTTHAPSVIVGDVDILAAAPAEMIRAGYADIIGKYSALCDWKLSAVVNGEYLCPMIYETVLTSTNELRAAAADITARSPEAIGKLMEILVLIGACLTLLGATRPGSGSEHHLSHFFEITGLIHDRPYFLHGIDVGYATVVTAAMRERILTLDAPVFRHSSADVRRACRKKIYGEYTDEVEKLQNEAGRYDRTTPEELYAGKWDAVRDTLKECPTADEITDMLTAVGFEMPDFEKMYGKAAINDGIWFGKDLKDRYSVLWLYYDLFFDKKEADKILRGYF